MRKGSTFQNLYSEEEEQFIKDHYKDMSAEEIAEHLGRSMWSVRQHMSRLMLTRKPGLETYRNEIYKYAREGYSAIAIAEILGFSKTGVTKFCKRYGIRLKTERRREV